MPEINLHNILDIPPPKEGLCFITDANFNVKVAMYKSSKFYFPHSAVELFLVHWIEFKRKSFRD